MKRTSVALTAVAVAGSLAGASGAIGQTPAPASSQSAPAAMAKEIEGKVRNLDARGKRLVLADGTELMIPDTVKVALADLKPGTTVKAAYEELNGRKVVKSLQVTQ